MPPEVVAQLELLIQRFGEAEACFPSAELHLQEGLVLGMDGAWFPMETCDEAMLSRLDELSHLAIVLLTKVGVSFADFEFCTPSTNVAWVEGESDPWFRLLLNFAGHSLSSADILDCPLREPERRTLKGNPFLVSQLVLTAFAERFRRGDAITDARSICHSQSTKLAGGDVAQDRPAGLAQYVTLDQCAALVNRARDTVYRWLREDQNSPAPDVEGGGGKPHEFRWESIRPWLEGKSGRRLPEEFPRLNADRH